ncbi:MAG: CoA-binding protein [Phototrophicaceae bacterium]
MANLNQDRSLMHDVLSNAVTVAVVGHSDKPHRTSYQIATFLRNAGYQVIPVNPTVSSIDGERCYPSLDAIPVPVDIVNVFRRSIYLADIVDETIAMGADTIWTQLGVIDTAAQDKALEAGLHFAMNLCIKVEYMRLGIKRQY